MKRDFLQVSDLTRKEIEKIFELAEKLKKKPYQPLLKNKTLAMLFAKPSTRTRVSFETGMNQLEGHAIYLGANDIQLSRGETIADTARTLSRYVDIIMARLFAHSDIEELARNTSIPVINGLTDDHHPCQALADLFTIFEKKKKVEKVAFIGDGGENTCTSIIQACQLFGIETIVGCPKEYQPVIKTKKTQDPLEAVRGADVVYTDAWVSMGQEKENEERIKILKPYQVNAKLMKAAKPDAIFMHCLPAHRGYEVTNDVIDGKQSVVWDEAENRLHTQKALMVFLDKGA
jgi:ornithine carbamoyltransferase